MSNKSNKQATSKYALIEEEKRLLKYHLLRITLRVLDYHTVSSLLLFQHKYQPVWYSLDQ